MSAEDNSVDSSGIELADVDIIDGLFDKLDAIDATRNGKT